MGTVVWGTDFKAKRTSELEQSAVEIMNQIVLDRTFGIPANVDLICDPERAALFGNPNTSGYVAPEKDPA